MTSDSDAAASERLYKGQRYSLVGHRPYTNRHGYQVTLEIWRSQCAECGTWFETTRSARCAKFERGRRCQNHKAPGRRV
jgi:hypothetical protein